MAMSKVKESQLLSRTRISFDFDKDGEVNRGTIAEELLATARASRRRALRFCALRTTCIHTTHC